MNIGRNIRKIRRCKGLTQKQLGEKLGVSQSAVDQFELNDSDPKVSTLLRIANALEVSIAVFFDSPTENGKKILEMTVEEILRQQLELLAEASKRCSETFNEDIGMLPEFTEAMISVTKELQREVPSNYLPLSSLQ